MVEELPDVIDSLVVHLEDPEGGQGELMLYVVVRPGVTADESLYRRIRDTLRRSLSPRHIPDEVVVVTSIPRSRTGKKLELPVKRILQGHDADSVASRDALVDPTSLEDFVDHAHRRELRT